MKNVFILLIGLLAATTFGYAQPIVRVQNGANIQNIIDDPLFVAGTILVLDPGTYAGFDVWKRTTIIGSGYFNGTNATVINGTVEFRSGAGGNSGINSDNSVIMGCTINTVYLNRNNITVQRCYMRNNDGVAINYSGYGTTMTIATNCRINQCFVQQRVIVGNGVSNFFITNNIILENTFINSNSNLSTTGRIANNTIGISLTNACQPLQYSSSTNIGITVANNILASPTTCNNGNGNQNYSTTNLSQFNNNVVRLGNYQSINTSNVFLQGLMNVLFVNQGTPDSQYMLSANSQARGVGENGIDCGAFGGSEPYVLTGAPLWPFIENIQVPTTARQNQTIQIRLRARAQN